MGADARTAAAAINRLASAIYKPLAADPAENVCFSPLGLAAALGAARAGAAGETEAELSRVLFVTNPEAFDEGCRELGQRIQASQVATADRVLLGTALWCQDGDPLGDAFVTRCKTSFRAQVAPVDFRADPEAARTTINAWVKEQSNSRILELFPSGAFDERTRLAITTAVEFQGTWLLRFDRKKTHSADFHLAAGHSISVPMMHKAARYRHAATDELQLVDLLFENDLAMTLLVPREIDGLKHAEELLVSGAWARVAAQARDQFLSLDLPRFSVQPERTDYTAVLKELGCRSAFSPAADFSRIRGKPGKELFLRMLRHATWMQVDEDGTRAVAATAVEIGAKSQPTIAVRADRPFVFLIRDLRSGVIVFAGRCVQPGSGEP